MPSLLGRSAIVAPFDAGAGRARSPHGPLPSPQDVTISVDKSELTILGERPRLPLETRLRSERPPGHFVRRFALPERVDPAGIDPSMKAGVLTVTLPKRLAALPHRRHLLPAARGGSGDGHGEPPD